MFSDNVLPQRLLAVALGHGVEPEQQIQLRKGERYGNQLAYGRKIILLWHMAGKLLRNNPALVGKFSSDRKIVEKVALLWHIAGKFAYGRKIAEK